MGVLLEPYWGVLGGLFGRLETILGHLGALLDRLGALLGCLGALLGRLEAILGRLGALLDGLGPSWRTSIKEEGGGQLGSPPGSPIHRLLDPSWGALGALLVALGAVLELSWASLGALLSQLGAILRPRMAIGSEKATKRTTLTFFWFLN